MFNASPGVLLSSAEYDPSHYIVHDLLLRQAVSPSPAGRKERILAAHAPVVSGSHWTATPTLAT